MNYVMDTPFEGRRLERKTDVRLAREHLDFAGLRPGHTAVDVGCGVGTVSRVMAGLAGVHGRVIGVDESAARLGEARRYASAGAAIEYLPASAEHLPLDAGTADLVWSRFLFEYLPDPDAVLREMIRVAKPGGAVVVCDLDGNCVWHGGADPELRSLLDTALDTLGSSFHPRAGLELYTRCARAGLNDLQVRIEPYHVIAGGIDPEREGQWQMKLDGVAAALRARGWSETQVNALVEKMMQHLKDRETFTYSTAITVRGTKR